MSDYVLRLREMVGPDVLLQLPSVSVAVRDGAGRLLMIRHAEGGRWLLPGGSIEPAELPADAALRETWEETGLSVRLTKLLGVFGGPEFVVSYREGERVSYVMTVFEAGLEGGEFAPDSKEVLEAEFFSLQSARRLDLAPWVAPVLAAVSEPGSDGEGFQIPSWSPPG